MHYLHFRIKWLFELIIFLGTLPFTMWGPKLCETCNVKLLKKKTKYYTAYLNLLLANTWASAAEIHCVGSGWHTGWSELRSWVRRRHWLETTPPGWQYGPGTFHPSPRTHQAPWFLASLAHPVSSRIALISKRTKYEKTILCSVTKIRSVWI